MKPRRNTLKKNTYLRAMHVPRCFQSLREANLPADQGPSVGFQSVLEPVVHSMPSPAAAQSFQLQLPPLRP